MHYFTLDVIPDHLLVRRESWAEEDRRAKQLMAFCERYGLRPTFLRLEQERRLRRLPRMRVQTPRRSLSLAKHRQAA